MDEAGMLTRVTDGVVTLRDPQASDAELLRLLSTVEHAGPFNDFEGPEEQALLKGDVGGGLAVIESPGGTGIGTVGWFGVPYGPNRRSVAWRIGITILVEWRGQGFGSHAQGLLAEHLLAATPSNRVEADVDTENHAERAALEKAGFTLEGTLRGAQYRAGAWRDLVLFSRVGS